MTLINTWLAVLHSNILASLKSCCGCIIVLTSLSDNGNELMCNTNKNEMYQPWKLMRAFILCSTKMVWSFTIYSTHTLIIYSVQLCKQTLSLLFKEFHAQHSLKKIPDKQIMSIPQLDVLFFQDLCWLSTWRNLFFLPYHKVVSKASKAGLLRYTCQKAI